MSIPCGSISQQMLTNMLKKPLNPNIVNNLSRSHPQIIFNFQSIIFKSLFEEKYSILDLSEFANPNLGNNSNYLVESITSSGGFKSKDFKQRNQTQLGFWKRLPGLYLLSFFKKLLDASLGWRIKIVSFPFFPSHHFLCQHRSLARLMIDGAFALYTWDGNSGERISGGRNSSSQPTH